MTDPENEPPSPQEEVADLAETGSLEAWTRAQDIAGNEIMSDPPSPPDPPEGGNEDP